MRVFGLLVLSASLLASSTLSAKPAPVVSLSFNGKWEVNYDTNSCHLLARFGSEKDGIVMRLTRFEPGDFFDLMFYGKPLNASGRDVKVTVDFGVSGEPIKRDGLAGHAGRLPFVMAGRMRIDGRDGNTETVMAAPVTREQEAAATALTIGYGGKLYRLETGRLDRPLAKLRECQTDLIKYWGYDPVVQAQLTRAPVPIGSPGRWAGPMDFPREALGNGSNGRVKFRLDIDATGAAKSCAVLEQTKPVEFGKVTCDILVRRGKFEPALDKDGKPVGSFWISSVVWLNGS